MARPKRVKTEQRPLTGKQQRFCEEYQIDLNATQAALRAGYAASSAKLSGHKNINKYNCKQEIQRIKTVLSQEIGVSVKWVVDNLKIVAKRCMQVIPVLDDEGNEIGDYKFEHTGANKALQLIGMHVGAFEADNTQKAAKVREYNIKELKVLIVEGDARDKRILEAGTGLAE